MKGKLVALVRGGMGGFCIAIMFLLTVVLAVHSTVSGSEAIFVTKPFSSPVVYQSEGLEVVSSSGGTSTFDIYTPTFSTYDEVEVYNTGGAGLWLRSGYGLSSSKVALMADGTQMTVYGGPYSADGYTWWYLYGYVSGMYDSSGTYWPSGNYWGYAAGTYLKVITSTPPTPTGTSPGSTTSPGPTQSSSTVTLSWGAVSGATYYGLGVRDVQTGNLVVDTYPTGTSYTASLTAGRQYKWNVAACNSAGCSSYTTPLYFQTPCSNSLSPTSQSVGSSGGSYSVSVSSSGSCSWTATSNVSWITITSGSSGSGNGTVYYSVSANTDTSQRTGTMTIAGQTFTVTQNPPTTVSVTFTTSPSGLSITVDGSSYTSPYTFSWSSGSSHTISVSTPQYSSDGKTRYSYSSWSDGGSQSHTITTPSSGQTYTASFSTEYSLDTTVIPSGSGSISLSPSGTWFSSSQSVQLTATANSGYAFSNWSGDLSGSSNPASLTMSGPKSITANFSQTTTTTTSITTTTTSTTTSTTITSQFSVVEHLMTYLSADDFSGEYSSGKTPPKKTVFLNTDTHATLWFSYKNAFVGDTVKREWYSPDGNIYYTSNGTFSYTNGWRYSLIGIKGSSAASKLGEWQVKVYRNDQLIFTETFTIQKDTTVPIGSISINSGALYTNSTTVTLNLSATDDGGVTGYYLSTSSSAPSVSDSGWTSVSSTTSYSESVLYTLSSGDGSKNVYVWYKDTDGKVSDATSDSITLDTTSPTITINSPTSSSSYTKQAVQ